MLKKILFIIIGIVIVLLISFALIHRVSSAKILQNCKPEDFKTYLDKDREEVDKITETKGNFTDFTFRVRFEKARFKYHSFVKCVFDEAVAGIVTSAGGDTAGIWSANAPNLPELLKPESACVQTERLTDILVDGSPENLLEPLLTAYNQYADHLHYLYKKSPENPSPIGRDFTTFQTHSHELGLIVESEIQDALVALDAAFIGLKEIRKAFVMHVHFQCMLKHLEAYRRLMENLRNVILAIPSLIEDASMHK